MVSQPIVPAQSILAGCPVSIAFAKVYLWQTLQHISKSFRPVKISSWVDDISLDLVGKDCKSLSAYMSRIFQDLRQRLKHKNLTINTDKSGFLCNTLALHKAMKAQTRKEPNMPQVKDTIRDLGLDSTAGRLRRIPVQRSRQLKGRRRLGRLCLLPKACAAKYVSTNIMPLSKWGHTSQGCCRTSTDQFRGMMAKAGKLRQTLGCLTTALRMACPARQDPAIAIPAEQLAAWIQLVKQHPPETRSFLGQVWQQIADRILDHPRHWSLGAGV